MVLSEDHTAELINQNNGIDVILNGSDVHPFSGMYWVWINNRLILPEIFNKSIIPDHRGEFRSVSKHSVS